MEVRRNLGAAKELNPENEELAIFGTFHFDERAIIEQDCSSARFYILNSYDTDHSEAVFESDESILEWLWSWKHGVFDRALVTKERLQNYSQPNKVKTANPTLNSAKAKICRRIVG